MTNSNINTADAFVGNARKNEGKKPNSPKIYLVFFFFNYHYYYNNLPL